MKDWNLINEDLSKKMEIGRTCRLRNYRKAQWNWTENYSCWYACKDSLFQKCYNEPIIFI